VSSRYPDAPQTDELWSLTEGVRAGAVAGLVLSDKDLNVTVPSPVFALVFRRGSVSPSAWHVSLTDDLVVDCSRVCAVYGGDPDDPDNSHGRYLDRLDDMELVDQIHLRVRSFLDIDRVFAGEPAPAPDPPVREWYPQQGDVRYVPHLTATTSPHMFVVVTPDGFNARNGCAICAIITSHPWTSRGLWEVRVGTRSWVVTCGLEIVKNHEFDQVLPVGDRPTKLTTEQMMLVASCLESGLLLFPAE
jgi:hypothetical protein